MNDYETTLKSLGSVPVSQVAREYWGDESAQSAYLKGERIDVNGWIDPQWVKSSIVLTPAQRDDLGIPRRLLTYDDYIALLDVDRYRQTRDPLQYAVMAFVLDAMLTEGVALSDPGKIIEVYEANVGLEDRALRLLKDHVSAEQAMQLYSRHRDGRLFEAFPTPRPEQETYIEFLRGLAERRVNRGWEAARLLFQMDPATYGAYLRDVLVAQVPEAAGFRERMEQYDALARIGDEPSVNALAAFVLTDPVTEAREAIVRSLTEAGICAASVVDSIEKLVTGQGEPHQQVTPSRMFRQWERTLRDYLTWIIGNDRCSAEVRAKADTVLTRLNT